MKISDINQSSWMYLERFVNDNSYSQFSTYSAVDNKYRPGGDADFFMLPYYTVPNEYLTRIDSKISYDKRLNSIIEDNNKLQSKFYVHPEMLIESNHRQWDDSFLNDFLKKNKPSGYEKAIPTSSTRTVYLPDHNLFIKLHIPKRISRFQRRVHNPYVSQNIETVDDLIPNLKGDYAILRDVIGVVQNKSDWGFIIRDAIPYPKENDSIIIPALSLYGVDNFSPKDDPILIQLIQASDQDPIKYTSTLIDQSIKAWWHIYSSTGLIVDPHGQNILFAFNDNLEFRNVVIRDFYAIDLDNNQRVKAGLKPIHTNMDASKNNQIGPTLSNVYDFNFGHHMMDFISRCLVKYFHIDENILQEAVRRSFNKYVDQTIMPNTTYKYADKTFTDGNEELVDTGKPPKWR